MKTLLAALCLVFMASDAFAIQRYTSTSMSCGEVQATIRADGAAIMRYQSTRVAGMQLFGRYVRNNDFCTRGEAAERVYIPAADTKSCPVRECKRVEFDDNFPIFRMGRD